MKTNIFLLLGLVFTVTATATDESEKNPDLNFFMGSNFAKRERPRITSISSIDLYFDQKLDHFNPSNTRTWKQVINE